MHMYLEYINQKYCKLSGNSFFFHFLIGIQFYSPTMNNKMEFWLVFQLILIISEKQFIGNTSLR